MFVILLGWVLFRADTPAAAGTYFKAMFNFAPGGLEVLLLNLDIRTVFALILGIIFSILIVPWLRRKLFAGYVPMSLELSGFQRIFAGVSVIAASIKYLGSVNI